MGWKPLDVIVGVIALTVCAVLVVRVMTHTFVEGRELSEQGLKVVGGLMGSFVAIVGTYVGSKIANRDRD